MRAFQGWPHGVCCMVTPGSIVNASITQVPLNRPIAPFLTAERRVWRVDNGLIVHMRTIPTCIYCANLVLRSRSSVNIAPASLNQASSATRNASSASVARIIGTAGLKISSRASSISLLTSARTCGGKINPFGLHPRSRRAPTLGSLRVHATRCAHIRKLCGPDCLPTAL